MSPMTDRRPVPGDQFTVGSSKADHGCSAVETLHEFQSGGVPGASGGEASQMPRLVRSDSAAQPWDQVPVEQRSLCNSGVDLNKVLIPGCFLAVNADRLLCSPALRHGCSDRGAMA